jgi:hypothetical protein
MSGYDGYGYGYDPLAGIQAQLDQATAAYHQATAAYHDALEIAENAPTTTVEPVDILGDLDFEDSMDVIGETAEAEAVLDEADDAEAILDDADDAEVVLDDEYSTDDEIEEAQEWLDDNEDQIEDAEEWLDDNEDVIEDAEEVIEDNEDEVEEIDDRLEQGERLGQLHAGDAYVTGVYTDIYQSGYS